MELKDQIESCFLAIFESEKVTQAAKTSQNYKNGFAASLVKQQSVSQQKNIETCVGNPT
jgi:hypothetical protein